MHKTLCVFIPVEILLFTIVRNHSHVAALLSNIYYPTYIQVVHVALHAQLHLLHCSPTPTTPHTYKSYMLHCMHNCTCCIALRHLLPHIHTSRTCCTACAIALASHTLHHTHTHMVVIVIPRVCVGAMRMTTIRRPSRLMTFPRGKRASAGD